jgi:hypothetical protein
MADVTYLSISYLLGLVLLVRGVRGACCVHRGHPPVPISSRTQGLVCLFTPPNAAVAAAASAVAACPQVLGVVGPLGWMVVKQKKLHNSARRE